MALLPSTFERDRQAICRFDRPTDRNLDILSVATKLDSDTEPLIFILRHSYAYDSSAYLKRFPWLVPENKSEPLAILNGHNKVLSLMGLTVGSGSDQL